MHCANCGALIASTGTITHCQTCGDVLSLHSSPVGSLSKPSAIPWEQMEDIGIIKAFLLTIRSSVLKPSTFFSGISEKSSLFHAWLFGLCAGSLGILFDFFSSNQTSSFLHNLTQLGNGSVSNINASLLIFSPLTLFTGIFLVSIYIHFLLSITRGRNNTFSATIITVCYAQSIAFLNIIPFIGKMIATIWGLYMIISGISAVHSISKTRSGLTILLPLSFLFFFFIVIMVIIVSGTLVSSTLFKEIAPLFR